MAYDQASYFVVGVERIWVNSRSLDAEIQLSPDFASPGYAFAPAFSPTGDRVAYLVNPSEIENMIFNLLVQDTNNGEPREYGVFEQVWQVHWTAEGGHLVFSAGPYDAQLVMELDLVDGSVRELAQGSETVPRP